jgi:hypothetical protein
LALAAPGRRCPAPGRSTIRPAAAARWASTGAQPPTVARSAPEESGGPGSPAARGLPGAPEGEKHRQGDAAQQHADRGRDLRSTIHSREPSTSFRGAGALRPRVRACLFGAGLLTRRRVWRGWETTPQQSTHPTPQQSAHPTERSGPRPSCDPPSPASRPTTAGSARPRRSSCRSRSARRSTGRRKIHAARLRRRSTSRSPR